jgi:hypothetical protein
MTFSMLSLFPYVYFSIEQSLRRDALVGEAAVKDFRAVSKRHAGGLLQGLR